MLKFASMRTLALGLASAALVMSPVAHAATSASYQWTDLSLSITDAEGNTTANNGFVTSGDSLWQNSLFLARTTPESLNYDIFDAAAQPTLQNTALVRDLVAAKAKVDLSVSAAGPSSFSVALTSIPGVPLSGPSQSGAFTLIGGFAPAFFKQYLQVTDGSLDGTPVRGGIWVAAGSTVTLSGKATATVSLDPADFERLADGAYNTIVASGSLNLGLVPDGESIGVGPANGQAEDGATAIVKLTPSLPGGGPLQDMQTSFVSTSMTNTSDAGQWLLFSGIGSVDLLRVSAPLVTPTTPGGNLIPEPSTYALMGLGLVGVAVASRRRRTASSKS